jgi:hypothetical protein
MKRQVNVLLLVEDSPAAKGGVIAFNILFSLVFFIHYLFSVKNTHVYFLVQKQ